MSAEDRKRNFRTTEIRERYCVEVLQFRVLDMKDLRTFLSPSRYASLTDSLILEIKCEEKSKKKLLDFRRKVIDEFVREKSGDPSMTALKFKEAKRLKNGRELNWIR
jgi:hypothetical protein